MAAEPRRAAADALGPGQEESLELPNSGHQGQPGPVVLEVVLRTMGSVITQEEII